ncbi:hypothetical protein [Candidatus Bathycorpusculum sp.]|jgi:uncharacterized protein YwgA|uniref:hypothetical protein n=1 Tax=Candidatus Bathycorpusculum sp. TaxID=2994959 RepID=UPI002828B339|nr:hypothetical protein [Candidatus Termitimicrobium sp.]MCL2685226.1 hypothetical protein [Candidatus Termitimicrobium sp.]
MSKIDKVIAVLKHLEVSPKIKDKQDYCGRFFTQKTVFLAQILGIDLNYVFSLYIAGPYSRDLAIDYYANADKIEAMNSNYTLTANETAILDRIKNCSKLYDSMALMEATTASVYIKHCKPEISEDDLFATLKELKPNLTEYDRLIGIQKAKYLLFKPKYLTEEIKQELSAWENID